MSSEDDSFTPDNTPVSTPPILEASSREQLLPTVEAIESITAGLREAQRNVTSSFFGYKF